MRNYIVLLCLSLCCLASLVVAQDKVQIVAVEMSRCPYCSLWKQNFQASVMSQDGLRDIVDIDEEFIATRNGSDIICMHGAGECVGNTILLCARNQTIAQSPWGWWDLGVCMQTDYVNIPDNAEACAQKVGLDWNTINTCVTNGFGAELFDKSIGVSVGLGVKSTPTIFINGKEYVGGPNNPLATVCDAYKGTKPPGCTPSHVSMQ